MRTRSLYGAALLACLSMGTSVASAQNLDTRPTWYIQAGQGDESSRAVVLGTTVPWKNWSWSLGSGEVRGHWDAWIGGWSNKDLNNRRFTTAALGVGPSLRWRGLQGSSPWFWEVGTGVMVTGKSLYNSGERIATRWNFASHIGMGMNFGPQRAHELSLRVQHASNAGIKKPNPGLNLVQLRYAHAF